MANSSDFGGGGDLVEKFSKDRFFRPYIIDLFSTSQLVHEVPPPGGVDCRSPPGSPPNLLELEQMGIDEARQIVIPFAKEMVEGDNIYKMTSKERGKVILFNNVAFEARRFGSNVDAARFETVFPQLNFTVRTEVNCTRDEMQLKLKEFANEDHPGNAAVVIILSHGGDTEEKIIHSVKTKVRTPDLIQGVDGNSIALADILQMFNNENCRNLAEKPKLFFILTCRGNKPDPGCPLSSDGNSVFHDGAPTELIASNTDMMVLHSTVQSHKAFRDPRNGSYCGRALVQALKENGDKEIYYITRAVERYVHQYSLEAIQAKREKTEMQATKTRFIGWGKEFYFNPGWPQ